MFALENILTWILVRVFVWGMFANAVQDSPQKNERPSG
ncbi:hypothetical protein SAMN05444581_11923 [Methylocapsa palsarum]|uniref:Uncharacterized protein n=1 Tax=Methylocapsa palsarum TaxID=1612308 RepID=A0A1I4CB37_9HYPH|nr:hypothetical protein SAMN05444581_11923 [Methylocapsa palsarum]